MPSIGFFELLVIIVVAIVVVGPEELPSLLRGVGKTMTQLRRMAGDFQRQFTQALDEAELNSLKKDLGDISKDISVSDIPPHSLGPKADQAQGTVSTTTNSASVSDTPQAKPGEASKP